MNTKILFFASLVLIILTASLILWLNLHEDPSGMGPADKDAV